MKLGLTDIQYNSLLTVLREQGETPAAEPEKGTSDKQAGGQGYPQVGKWESGVTRGPGNQVGVTKWADVVGSKLTRSKANPLKEQEGRGDAIAVDPEGDKRERIEKERKKKEFDDNFIVLTTPRVNSYNKSSIIIPINSEYKLWNKNDDRVQAYFKIWEATVKQREIPQGKDEQDFNDMFDDGCLEYFDTPDGGSYVGQIIKKDGRWIFNWYVDQTTKQHYNQELYLGKTEIPEEYIKDWFDIWGSKVFLLGSLLIPFLIPGVGGIAIAFMLDMSVATIQVSRGDTFNGAISAICAFLPALSLYFKWGAISVKETEQVLIHFKDAKSMEDIISITKTIPDQNIRYILRKLLEKTPQELELAIKEIIKKSAGGVIKDNLTAIRIVGALNYMIRSGKIERAVAESMWKTIIGRNVKILGAQLGAIIGATFGHELITRYQSEKFFNELSQHKFDELSDNSNLIFNLKELPIEFQLVGLNGYIINNLKKGEELDTKLTSILQEYRKKYENNPNYYLNLFVYLLKQFIKNSDQDFKKLVTDYETKNK